MPWFEKNISFIENFTGHFRFLKMLIQVFFRCANTYNNFLFVFSSVLKSRYPIIGFFKNNKKIQLNNFYHVNFFTKIKNSQKIKYDLDNDIVEISAPFFPNGKIKLHDAIDNGDIVDVYLDELYAELPVENNTVVDIGANIGDSSIYFALKGAKKIISLEPFPKNYEMAKKNIELNKFSEKIHLLLQGCSNRNDYSTIDPEFISGVDSKIFESKNGIKIPITTLDQIIKDHDVEKKSILKIDCEGCEYDILLSSSSEVLQTFSQIFVEYHYGYKDLRKKLEASGFQVSVTSPGISGQLSFLSRYFNKSRKPKISTNSNVNKETANNSNDLSSRLSCVGQIHAIKI